MHDYSVALALPGRPSLRRSGSPASASTRASTVQANESDPPRVLAAGQCMKFIAAVGPESSLIEPAPAGATATAVSYVDYSTELRDLGLEMPVADHAAVVRTFATSVDADVLRREQASRLRRDLVVQAERAEREARIFEQVEQDKKAVSVASRFAAKS
jgi:hypothetical protein